MTDTDKSTLNENDCGCSGTETVASTAVAFPIRAYRELFPQGLGRELVGDEPAEPVQCMIAVKTIGKGEPFKYKPDVKIKEDCPEPTATHRAEADALAAKDLEDYAKAYCGKGTCDDGGSCTPRRPLEFTVTSRQQSDKPTKGDKTQKDCFLTTSYSATVKCVCNS